jgi:hypothetical protein
VRSRRFIPLVVFLVTWSLTTHGKYSVTGDEPHYLITATSLLLDGDIDLRNNYDNGNGRLFGSPGLIPELHARAATDGRFLPVHDVGLPVLTLPVLAVALKVSSLVSPSILARFRMTPGLFAYSLVSLWIAGLFALAAMLTDRSLRAGGAPARRATTIVLAAWLTVPVLSNSFLLFPESIALLVTAWTVMTASGPQGGWRPRDTALVFALGALPWVHRKYIVYAAALLVTLLWQRREELTRGRAARLVLLFGLPGAALALWTAHYWGSLAGPLAVDRLPFSLDAFAHGAAGTFFDRENGLFVWAPAYALLPAAWWLAGPGHRIWALPIVALVVPGAAHDQWWGGFSPAARFLVPAVPIACVLFSEAVARSRQLAVAAAILLVPQAVMAACGWQKTRWLWPQGDGHNRILELLSPGLNDWLPSLRTASSHAWLRTFLLLAAVAMVNALLAARTQPSRPAD